MNFGRRKEGMKGVQKETYLLHKRGNGTFLSPNLNVSRKWMVDTHKGERKN